MIRFLADASLHHAIVSGCRRREPTIDFLSAHEAGLEGLPDSAVLSLAASQDRILVTHDIQTMPGHFGDFLQTHNFAPAVILVSQSMSIAVAIEELVLIWSATSAEEWRNRILRIPLP